MSPMYGADVQQLGLLAMQFDRAADCLESCRLGVGQAVHGTAWVGPDAEAFRAQWDGRDAAFLSRAAAQLRDGAQRLQLKSTAQEQASSVSADGGLASADGVCCDPVTEGAPGSTQGVPIPAFAPPTVADADADAGGDVLSGAGVIGGVGMPAPVEVEPGASGPGVIGPVTNPSHWYSFFNRMAEELGKPEFGTPDSDHDSYNDNQDYRPTDPDRY